MKKKFFNSTNSKKGILLETGGDDISISIWKKETPISLTIDKDTAYEICNFISLELKDSAEEAARTDHWINFIKECKEKAHQASLVPDSEKEKK